MPYSPDYSDYLKFKRQQTALAVDRQLTQNKKKLALPFSSYNPNYRILSYPPNIFTPSRLLPQPSPPSSTILNIPFYGKLTSSNITINPVGNSLTFTCSNVQIYTQVNTFIIQTDGAYDFKNTTVTVNDSTVIESYFGTIDVFLIYIGANSGFSSTTEFTLSNLPPGVTMFEEMGLTPVNIIDLSTNPVVNPSLIIGSSTEHLFRFKNMPSGGNDYQLSFNKSGTTFESDQGYYGSDILIISRTGGSDLYQISMSAPLLTTSVFKVSCIPAIDTLDQIIYITDI